MLDSRIGSILKWKSLAALLLTAVVFFLLWKLWDLPVPLCAAVAVVVALLVIYIRRPFWEWLIDMLSWW